MELVGIAIVLWLLWLLIGPFILWGRTKDLSRRQAAIEQELSALRASLARVHGELDELGAAKATRRAGRVPGAAHAAVPVAAPVTPAVPTAAAPVTPTARVGRAAAPEPVAERAATIARAEEARRMVAPLPPGSAPAPHAAVQPAPTAPIKRRPAGPSLLDRLLRGLGLTPPTGGEGWSRAALEAWLEGRLLAVVGGVALILGAIFFLSLAFSKGWITEEMRVLIGLLAGVGLLVLGELAFARLRGNVGHVLVAVGLAVISLALLAATRLYELVPVEWGLAGAFVSAVAAAFIAVRHGSQVVAAFGLVAVLAAPPLLGASPTLITLLFVAATLIGATGVALFRTWVWLPPLAFVLAAPQLASYVTGSPPVAEGLIAIAGFWLVNTIAAGGEETRHRTARLRTATVTLLLATAAFTLWAGFVILSASLETWRGTFVAVLALAYLGLGLTFLGRFGDRHPFGLVVAATGVAAAAMAVPVQFGGPPVPVAWAAEAVALAWVAVIRRHPYSAAVAVILGALALTHLVVLEYPADGIAAGFERELPFVGPEGMTFAFVIAALIATGLAVPIAWVRAGLAVIGVLASIYVFPFELSGPALVGGWTGLAAAGFIVYARVVAPRIGADFREDRVAALALPGPVVRPVSTLVASLSQAIRPSFVAAATVAGVAALGHYVTYDYPLDAVDIGTAHELPFVGLPGLSAGIVLAGILAVGLFVRVPWVIVGLTALAGLVVAYAFPFELSGPALVWAWAVVATAAFFVETRIIDPRVGKTFVERSVVRHVRPAVRAVGALVGSAVVAHLVAFDFPLGSIGGPVDAAIPYAGEAGLSLVGAMAALGAAGWLLGAPWIRLGLAGIGLALLAYSATFEIALPHVSVAWGIVAIASVAVVRRVALVQLFPPGRSTFPESIAERLPYAAAALALLFLVVQSLALAGPDSFQRHLTGALQLDGTPFLDQRTYVLAALAATLALAGLTWGGMVPRLWGVAAAGLSVAWLLPFEIRPGYAVAGWSVLALGGLWLVRTIPAAPRLLGTASLGLGGAGALVALMFVAPPDRLVVDASTDVLGWPILTDATVALGALAVALGFGAALHRQEPWARPVLIVAAVAGVYLLSVGVVDLFQRQVGTRSLDDLQKEAQVGLSVLWSILGGVGFAGGLLTHRPPVRLFGLALLGLATVKVFLVDLAALDVAYRVLSLVALGVLLLISAVFYARMQHPHGPVAPRQA
jgi:hypothetical protein